MRKATSESWRISLSVSCDTPSAAYPRRPVDRQWGKAVESPSRLGGRASLEVLVARTVVALRQRRPLARLALARRCTAARDTAVERAGLDLLLDERERRIDPLRH